MEVVGSLGNSNAILPMTAVASGGDMPPQRCVYRRACDAGCEKTMTAFARPVQLKLGFGFDDKMVFRESVDLKRLNIFLAKREVCAFARR